jgi:hypothetical protein
VTGPGRLLPAARRAGTARRTPFVVLVVVLLASGLIGLLVLNSAVNQGSFQLTKLQHDTDRLTDEQQELQQDVDRFSDPRELSRRAEKLGMVPGGNPAFLTPDGRLRGIPGTATATPAPGATPQTARTRPVEPGRPVRPGPTHPGPVRPGPPHTTPTAPPAPGPRP